LGKKTLQKPKDPDDTNEGSRRHEPVPVQNAITKLELRVRLKRAGNRIRVIIPVRGSRGLIDPGVNRPGAISPQWILSST